MMIEQQTRKTEALELILFGAALGNPDLREKITPEIFADPDLQAAVAEICSAKGRTSFPCLRKVLLETAGTLWQDVNGSKPVDRLITRQRLQIDAWRALAYIGRKIGPACSGHVTDKTLTGIADLIKGVPIDEIPPVGLKQGPDVQPEREDDAAEQ